MRCRVALVVAAWLSLAIAGWLTTTQMLAAIAPLCLLALPPLVARTRLSADEQHDPLEPIWLLTVLFGFTYLLVPPLSILDPAQFASLPGYLDTPPTHWQVGTWVAALAFIGMVYGYFGPLGPRLSALMPAVSRDVSARRTAAVALVFFVIGVGAVIQAVVIAGGLRVPLGDLITGGLRSEALSTLDGRGYLSLGFGMLALSIPCIALWASVSARASRWYIVALTTLVAELLLAGVLGSRLLPLSVPVGLLAVYHYRVRRLSTATVLGAGAAILATAIYIAGVRGNASVLDPLGAAGVLSGTLDGYNFLVNALARIDHFSWGSTVAGDATLTYLPRAIWEGKPVFYGVLAAQDAIVPGLHADVGGRATFPPGIVAEGYVNFGVFGAVGFPLLAGAAARAAYIRVSDHASGFWVVFFGWFLANQLSVMRGLGPMIAPMALTAVMLVPLLSMERDSGSRAPA